MRRLAASPSLGQMFKSYAQKCYFLPRFIGFKVFHSSQLNSFKEQSPHLLSKVGRLWGSVQNRNLERMGNSIKKPLQSRVPRASFLRKHSPVLGMSVQKKVNEANSWVSVDRIAAVVGEVWTQRPGSLLQVENNCKWVPSDQFLSSSVSSISMWVSQSSGREQWPEVTMDSCFSFR